MCRKETRLFCAGIVCFWNASPRVIIIIIIRERERERRPGHSDRVGTSAKASYYPPGRNKCEMSWSETPSLVTSSTSAANRALGSRPACPPHDRSYLRFALDSGTTVRFQYPIWTIDRSRALEHVSCGFPQHSPSYTRASTLVYDTLSKWNSKSLLSCRRCGRPRTRLRLRERERERGLSSIECLPKTL